jgi:hypothetical protein
MEVLVSLRHPCFEPVPGCCARGREATLAALEPRLGRERALAATLERYLEYAATDQPVHFWPTSR